MELKILAVSAPDWVSGSKSVRALNSRTPVSLQNASRLGALKSNLKLGSWGNSNWVGSPSSRRSKTLLLYSLDELCFLEKALHVEKPNLLLIGAMSLCFPGAIECAKLAKEILGDNVLIVLGGRHVNETVYLLNDNLTHHPSSPLLLMKEKKIPPVFDCIVSGDGEHVIAEIGDIVPKINFNNKIASLADNLEKIKNSPGKWIVGFIHKGVIKHVSSKGHPLDYSQIPSPVKMFGVSTSFDVFGENTVTAHSFSDIGRGCVYNCGFCSERSDVTGPVRNIESSPERLYRQLRDACETIHEEYGTKVQASAFIEDSVLLGGSPKLLRNFYNNLCNNPIKIKFGAQLTIDQILSRKEELILLKKVGLDYLFIGLETFSPEDIGGMSKDVGHKKSSWLIRATEVMEFLKNVDIKCGAAILFGLGEPHKNRLALLEQIKIWRKSYGMPSPVSMNWGTQHPLCGGDSGANYEYIEWGTSQGELLDLFHNFGEASEKYPLVGVEPPKIKEVRELVEFAKANLY